MILLHPVVVLCAQDSLANRVQDPTRGNGCMEPGEKRPVIRLPFTVGAQVYVPNGQHASQEGLCGGIENLEQINFGLQRLPAIYLRRGAGLRGGYGDGAKWLSRNLEDVITPDALNHVALTGDSTVRIIQKGAASTADIVREIRTPLLHPDNTNHYTPCPPSFSWKTMK